MKTTYFKISKILFLLSLILISCSKEEEDLLEDDSNSDTIYASKAPYFLTPTSDCNANLAYLHEVIEEAATSKKRLVIDGGFYCINGTLKIPSDIEIDFSGATIERADGAQVFPLIQNSNPISGNKNIVILNLIIDGNKENGLMGAPLNGITDANGNGGDLFSGLELSNTKDSRLENITIIKTVNVENLDDRISDETSDAINAAGLHIANGSSRILCKNINAYDNMGAGVMFTDSNNITIDGSLTEDNTGSGIGSSKSSYCNYLNIRTHNNGNSNLSVNGGHCKVSNVTTSSSGLSGLNIGHMGTNPSDFTIIDNVHSFENEADGISIAGSKHILVSNVHLENNARNNMLIFRGASKVQINNAVIHGAHPTVSFNPEYLYPECESTNGNGISIKSGGGHSINNSLIYDNWFHGIGIYGVTGLVSIGSETYIYNNGSFKGHNNSIDIKIAGVYLGKAFECDPDNQEPDVFSLNCTLNGTNIYSDQSVKTQDYGIWVNGGGRHRFIYTQVWGNEIQSLYESPDSLSSEIIDF